MTRLRKKWAILGVFSKLWTTKLTTPEKMRILARVLPVVSPELQEEIRQPLSNIKRYKPKRSSKVPVKRKKILVCMYNSTVSL